MSDYKEKFQREWDRSCRHHKKRIALVGKIKNKKFVRQLKELVDEVGAHWSCFVRTTENGKKQESEYPAIKWEWVDQYEDGGYSGDSFSGYIYIQIKENRFLKFAYSM